MIPVAKAGLDIKMKSDEGSPPYQDKNNTYGILANQMTNNLDSDSDEEYNSDLPGGWQPNKKQKVLKSNNKNKDQDFMEACDEAQASYFEDHPD